MSDVCVGCKGFILLIYDIYTFHVFHACQVRLSTGLTCYSSVIHAYVWIKWCSSCYSVFFICAFFLHEGYLSSGRSSILFSSCSCVPNDVSVTGGLFMSSTRSSWQVWSLSQLHQFLVYYLSICFLILIPEATPTKKKKKICITQSSPDLRYTRLNHLDTSLPGRSVAWISVNTSAITSINI